MPWGVANYNTNPDLNTAINGHDMSEGSAAAGYDDAFRQLMADIATWTAAYAVTYPIAVNKGGTGAITAPDALTNLGALAAQYQYLPVSTASTAFGYVPAYNGGLVRYTGSGANASIAPNSTYNHPPGATIVTANDGSGVLTYVPGTGVTLVWAATGATGGRNLAVGGIATIIQVATDRWFITGSGVS